VSAKVAVISTWLVLLILATVLLIPASAAPPANAGTGYPATFWAKVGRTNTVTGKIIASSNAKLGLEGAYIAIVNASNVNEEYANTTSGPDGSYNFEGVSATYFQNFDSFTDVQYQLYAYREPYGEAYSAAFAIDAASVGTPMEVWVVIPVVTPTVRPTIAPTSTAIPTPVPAESTPAPVEKDWSLRDIAIVLAVVAIILAGAGAYLYLRKR
jgi:hypothetical protein